MKALLSAVLFATSVAVAQAPVPPADPNAPQLTHDEKVKLFDIQDQRQELLKRYTEKYQAEAKPIDAAEADLKKKLEDEHPGYNLEGGQGGFQFVKKVEPKKEEPKKK